MFPSDIKVPINFGILLVVEDIQEYLDSELQIQAYTTRYYRKCYRSFTVRFKKQLYSNRLIQ